MNHTTAPGCTRPPISQFIVRVSPFSTKSASLEGLTMYLPNTPLCTIGLFGFPHLVRFGGVAFPTPVIISTLPAKGNGNVQFVGICGKLNPLEIFSARSCVRFILFLFLEDSSVHFVSNCRFVRFHGRLSGSAATSLNKIDRPFEMIDSSPSFLLLFYTNLSAFRIQEASSRRVTATNGTRRRWKRKKRLRLIDSVPIDCELRRRSWSRSWRNDGTISEVRGLFNSWLLSLAVSQRSRFQGGGTTMFRRSYLTGWQIEEKDVLFVDGWRVDVVAVCRLRRIERDIADVQRCLHVEREL